MGLKIALGVWLLGTLGTFFILNSVDPSYRSWKYIIPAMLWPIGVVIMVYEEWTGNTTRLSALSVRRSDD